jgi:penicillin-binding protein 1C
VTGAAPIFHGVMLAAEKRFGGRTDSLLEAGGDAMPMDVCSLSGAPANDWCPSKRREWLGVDGDEPACSWHHLGEDGLLVLWPPQYRQWAKQNGRLDDVWRYSERPFEPGGPRPGVVARRATAPVALEISSPAAGSVYLIDPTLRREFQALPLRVVASRPGRISWSIDGRPLGQAASDAAMMWPLAAGSHRITATDEQGRRAETNVTVK